MRRLVLAVLVAVPVLATSGAHAQLQPCTAHRLAGSFVHVPNSEGAGSVSYRVRLRNTGSLPCTVSGRPGLRLYGRHGHRLPARVTPDGHGPATPAVVTLAPHQVAVALARFSPDIPGPHEPTDRPCEPRAWHVRIFLPSPGTGSVAGPVRPPTSVCQHGRIALGLLHRR